LKEKNGFVDHSDDLLCSVDNTNKNISLDVIYTNIEKFEKHSVCIKNFINFIIKPISKLLLLELFG